MKLNVKFYCVSILAAFLIFSCALADGVQASLLNQYPDPARAGDTVEVRIRLTNPSSIQTGGIASGVETGEIWIEAVPDYPFTLLLGDDIRQVIASLPSYPAEASSKVVTFRFKVDSGAKDGQYKIKFRHSTNKGTTWVSYEFNIQVTAVEFAEISSITPTKLMPGKETEMVFTITNQGNAPLQNMVFSWSEESGVVLPVGSDNTKYIKYLDIGDSLELKYNVIASAEATPNLYKLDLSLEYDLIDQNGNVSKQKTTTKAGIFVGGTTDFDVTFSESSAGQTSLSVANIGANRALSVTVKIPQQDNFEVSGSAAAIIGNLDKGDYTIVSFQIVSKTVPGSTTRQNITRQSSSTNLKVLIEYTDTTGTRQSVVKEVPIQFKSLTTEDTTQTRGLNRTTTQQIWQNPFVIGGAAVVLIGGAFWYWRRKAAENPTAKKLIK